MYVRVKLILLQKYLLVKYNLEYGKMWNIEKYEIWENMEYREIWNMGKYGIWENMGYGEKYRWIFILNCVIIGNRHKKP